MIFADGAYVASVTGGFQLWPHEQLALSVELSWAAFNQRTRTWTQPFLGMAGRGALVLGLAASWRWEDS